MIQYDTIYSSSTQLKSTKIVKIMEFRALKHVFFMFHPLTGTINKLWPTTNQINQSWSTSSGLDLPRHGSDAAGLWTDAKKLKKRGVSLNASDVSGCVGFWPVAVFFFTCWQWCILKKMPEIELYPHVWKMESPRTDLWVAFSCCIQRGDARGDAQKLPLPFEPVETSEQKHFVTWWKHVDISL